MTLWSDVGLARGRLEAAALMRSRGFWLAMGMVWFAAGRPCGAACPAVPANPNCGFATTTPPQNCAAGKPGVEFWDCRLNCILTHIQPASPAPGQGHWQLVRAEFEPEGYDYPWQAHGGVYIYYRALDAFGNPIAGQVAATTNFNRPGQTFYQSTDAGNGFWATQPMEGQTSTFTNCVCTTAEIWPYTGWISETGSPAGYVGPSDRVVGMGLTNPPYGTFCNAHVNYRLTFRWTPPSAPVIVVAPGQLARTVVEGRSPAPDTLMLTNAGGTSLRYQVTTAAGWLTAAPGSGTLAAQESAAISVRYAVDGLRPGVHRAPLEIRDPDAVPSQVSVPVQLLLRSLYLGDFDGDHDVDAEDFGHLQACIGGPGVAVTEPACLDARFDTDIDIDQDEVNAFTNCLSGPGAVPGESCLN